MITKYRNYLKALFKIEFAKFSIANTNTGPKTPQKVIINLQQPINPDITIGAARGEHRERSPRNGKNCCRKMMLFPKALFLATTFPKIDKNSIFLMNFFKKFQNFLKNYPNNYAFRQNALKLNAGF